MPEKPMNPLPFVVVILLLAGGFAYLFVNMMRESPLDVVRSYYECKDYDKQMMYLTPESAKAFDRFWRMEAQRNLMSFEDYKRNVYNRDFPKIVKLSEPREVGRGQYLVEADLVYPDGARQTETLVVVRVGGSWKIDLRESQKYMKELDERERKAKEGAEGEPAASEKPAAKPSPSPSGGAGR